MTGCASAPNLFKKSAITQKEKVEQVVNDTKEKVEKLTTKIEDKGTAFVYGAKYSLSFETNKTHAINTSETFLNLATLTLGNPSVSDAKTIREITDNLLNKYKIDLEKAKQGQLNAELKVSQNEDEIKQIKSELKESEKREEAAIKKVELGNKTLTTIEKELILLQKDKELLEGTLNKKIKDLEEVNKENAQMAAQYQVDNSFWAKINPFNSLFDFVKKLFGWGLFLGVVFIVFKVLEIFFPGLNILSVIFGGIGKMVMKIVPGISKAMGLVSVKVSEGFKGLVKATEDSLRKIEQVDIESQIIKNYPDDYKFNKSEVKVLLEQLSEEIEKLIKEELKEHTDNDSRALVSKAKIDLGIKSETKNIEI